MPDYNEQKKYSDEISRLRYHDAVPEAIEKCREACLRFPDSNFFYKILGDLFVQTNNFEQASFAYLNQLKRLQEKPHQFKTFARFYKMLEQKGPEGSFNRFRDMILTAIEKREIDPIIQEKLVSFSGETVLQDEETLRFIELAKDDKHIRKIKAQIDNSKNIKLVRAIIHYRIQVQDRSHSHQMDDYFVSIGEKLELYDLTLQLIEKMHMQSAKPNPTVIRTLFRICRKQETYSFAEKLLTINKAFVDSSDFNIQYELVYFFESKGDEELLRRTLHIMRTQSATSSIPIARTLYNFYLKFDQFEEAKELSDHIRSLETAKHTASQTSRTDEQLESEQGVWNKLQDLVSEQEHNRQMIALRDLLKGFSHELGQPITNIRYSAQLYQMKAQKGLATPESIHNLLDLILRQTDRIGAMLDRFRPIVSSKSKEEHFMIFDRIEAVFSNLSVRLTECGITYTLTGNKTLRLWGDPVQFDQIFYNLILNSMQAIAETQKSGMIQAHVSVTQNGDIKLSFSDNGPGIAHEKAKKVFEPFYSTKDPTSGNGGEGLGLFIVWNILKMLNGKISLDNKFTAGAKFILTITPKEATENEQGTDHRG